jgi:hypothetical protein
MASPLRVVRLMRQYIEAWSLDLSGLVVLTEAASGYYAVTSVLAAMAGADQVLALTQDSQYGTADQVRAQTRALETLCDLPTAVEIYTQRDLALFAQADIVTNLGFVRPIDAQAVGAMKPTTVVPLMCEVWETRPSDVDLAACRERGILVMGTNESAPGLRVFEFCGPLGVRMLLEAGLEIYQNRIVIVSSDRFGDVLLAALRAAGAEVIPIGPAALREQSQALVDCDAIVLADYAYPGALIGENAPLSGTDLAALASGTVVIQFAGGADVADLARHGIPTVPPRPVGPFRMGQTLAALGPKPVIDLHGAGLKIGQLMALARQSGLEAKQAEAAILRDSTLAQSLKMYPT